MKTFEGRFHAPYSAGFEDYYAIDWHDIGVVGFDTPGQVGGRSGYYEYSADPVGVVDRVAKLMTSADPSTSSRIELRPMERDFGDAAGPVFGEQWWFEEFYWPSGSFDFYEPSGGTITSGGNPVTNNLCNRGATMGQHHQWPDDDDNSGLGTFPPIQFRVEGNKVKLVFCYDTNATSTVANPNEEVVKAWPLGWFTDRWVKRVMNHKSAYDNTGFWKLYIDGSLEYERTGVPTAFNNPLGPFTKGGIYKSFGSNAPRPTMTIYSKGWVRGDDASSYAEVTGESSRPSAGRGLRRAA